MIRQDMCELGSDTEDWFKKALHIYTHYKPQQDTPDDYAIALLQGSPHKGEKMADCSPLPCDGGSSPEEKMCERKSKSATPPSPIRPPASRSVCVSGRADVLASLSSLWTLRGDVPKALKCKEAEVHAREEGGVITRALASSLWELAAMYVASMHQKAGPDGLAMDNDKATLRAREAHLCRVKAIDAVTSLYGASHKRVSSYTDQHEDLNDQHKHLLPASLLTVCGADADCKK
jgi:hypothetical protein